MKWLEAKVVLENQAAIEAADVVADIFSDFGLQGTVMEEPGGEPEEGWGEDAVAQPEEYAVIGYFPRNELLEEKRNRLEERLLELSRSLDIRCRIQYGEMDEEDWAESWKAFFYPEKLTDRIVVKPTWREYIAGPDEIILEIDPGMAFGTGIHPTTSTCIGMIESYLTPEDRMLDVGTGSGILMIAGAKLGASKMVGVDLDEVAVEIAQKNLLVNGISPDRFEVVAGNLLDQAGGKFDLVTANILSEVILRLLDDIGRVMADKGVLIVSGIIEKNKDRVLEKLIATGFEIIDVRLKEGWATLAGKYRG
jgi:ribosomal protein L11 methyltransferase